MRSKTKKVPSETINLIMDGTFFSKTDGLMVGRANGKNVYWAEIKTEKVNDYKILIDDVINKGYKISSFVIDGRKGVKEMLEREYPEIPIQSCQYHQKGVVKRYLPGKTKSQAGRELKKINSSLTKSRKDTFINELDEWHKKWGEYIKERTYHKSGKRKWSYTHSKVRSAYFSLKNNLPYLFTYQDHPELNIPNTTNSCEGSFGHWKPKLNVHRGLNKENRKKMIDSLLSNC